MRLTEHAVALGKEGAKSKWKGMNDAERKEIMKRVRAAKKRRPRQSDAFALMNESLKFQNERDRKEK